VKSWSYFFKSNIAGFGRNTIKFDFWRKRPEKKNPEALTKRVEFTALRDLEE
jgi:hypothetical protein